jgi:predicted MFS family arabinose efflux permease
VSSWRIWLAVVALGVGSFAIVTTELAPIGFLSSIATDLGQSENKVGLIVTVYAWVAAVAALISATTPS